MANGHGGARPGAGRATRAEVMGLPMLIEDVIGEQGNIDIIKKIFEQAKGGSFNHQQLIMAYMYGKPSDHVDITTGGDKIETVKEIIFRDYVKPGV